MSDSEECDTVSDRAGGRGGTTATDRAMTKAEKRAAAKAAAARAAAAKRRRQALTGTLAGLAVVGLLIAAFVLLFEPGDDPDGNGAGGATSAPPAAAGTAGPPAGGANPQFPPLPPGADPALRTRPAVTAGGAELSRLAVTTLVAGTGPAAQAGQTITVNYVGVSYRTGQEFDSSWRRSEPFSFPLGQSRVIRGWDEGLVGVKVGSRVQLDIPANLGYGDSPTGGQPAGPLRFIVDVLGVA